MQGTASSFLTDVNKILKELYTGEYTVEKTAEEIDQAWDREAQEEYFYEKTTDQIQEFLRKTG